MGRHSRSRKVQRKKVETASPLASSEPREEDEGGGGSIMNMRSGFKNITGSGEEKAKPSTTSSLISWIVLGLVAVALIMFFMAR